jgi:hypothetical protein
MSVTNTPAPARTIRSWQLPAGLGATAAGAVLITGACLPWVTTFAGLVAISGLRGSNGRILAALGAVIAVAGLYHAFRGGPWSRWLAGLAGFAATGFCGFLLPQLAASLRSLSTDSMVAARSGPGLWVCAAGSVLAFGTLFLPRSGQQTLVHRRPGGGLLAWAADHDSAGLRRGLQAALGVAWLADGALQLQPVMFTRGFVTQILLPATMGNPAGVSGPAMAFGRLVLHDPAGWNAAFAVTQLLLGAGLLWRRTVRAALAASVGWALAVWWLGEGLGGVLGGMASPLTGAPGAVILYALLAVLLWPGRGAGRPGYSVAAGSPLRPSGATLAWLVLWASSAYYLLQPANRAPLALHDAVAGLATGQPGWLAAVDRAVAGAVGSGGAAVSIALAAACLAIAAGLLGRATTRPALLLSGLLALAIWVAGENFGGLFTGQATDPSSGPLLILLAAAYWPASRAHAAPASPRPGVTLATHSPAHGGGHGHGGTVAWAGRDARGRGPAAGRG